MNIKKLQSTYHILIRHLDKELHYSKSTIRDYQNVVDLILKLDQSIGGIKSYAEVYDYLAREMKLTASTLRGKCTKIKRIADFEELDLLPCYHEHSSPLFLKDKYSRLNEYYRNITDAYFSGITGRDYAEKTLYCQRNILAGFFYHLQTNNTTSLDKVMEDVVLSYFNDGGEELRGTSCLQMIKSSMEALADTVQDVDFSLLASFLPQKKKRKKIYPSLDGPEVEKLKSLLFDDNKRGLVSKRDRAIVMTAMYTGLRGCDIASWTIDDIDKENNELHILQNKGGKELRLTLSPCVSNAIYDYITDERPEYKNKTIFLTNDKDTRPITRHAVSLLARKFFITAGVRAESGRKGLHLLRHHFATALLDSGVSAPVISKVLGHSSPRSLDAYLETNLQKLKACALSIANYQLGKGHFYE